MCISTAVIAAIIVALLAVGEFVIHYVNPNWLTRSSTTTIIAGNDTSAETSVKSSLPSSDAAFLAVVAVLGLLAAITAGNFKNNYLQ